LSAAIVWTLAATTRNKDKSGILAATDARDATDAADAAAYAIDDDSSLAGAAASAAAYTAFAASSSAAGGAHIVAAHVHATRAQFGWGVSRNELNAFDLHLNEAELTAAVISSFTTPLWFYHAHLPKSFERCCNEWAQALRQLASSAKDDDANLEAERLIRIYNSFVAGNPSWEEILPPNLYDSLRLEFPKLAESPSAVTLTPAKLPCLVGRLAFLDPTHRGLAEAPTPERFQAALEMRALAGADSVVRKAEMLAEGLEPDPLWQAWFVASQAAFLNQPLPQAITATGESKPISVPPPSPAPKTEIFTHPGPESASQRLKKANTAKVETTRTMIANSPTPKKK
jgi:hypothetical protein